MEDKLMEEIMTFVLNNMGNKEMMRLHQMQSDLQKYYLKSEEAIKALEEIADEDFRGNRSSGSVKAFNALKKLGAR